MNTRTNLLRMVFGLSVLLVAVSQLAAQGGPRWGRQGVGRGRGPGAVASGGGPGRGAAWARPGASADAQFVADRDVFHFLLQNHDQIRRNVKNTKTGVETLTESDNPEIAAKLQEHVAAMAQRVEEQRPIHMRDPLFAELFRHADKIHLKYDKTPKGVRVVETSEDPYVAQLIQAHAGVVSLFVKNGFVEARTDHPLPEARRDATTTAVSTGANTAIAGCPAGCPLGAAGQCPRAAAGQCPNAAAGQCPKAAAGQCPKAAAGQCPNAAAGQCPNAAAGQCPKAAAGQCPKAAAGQCPKAAAGQCLNAAAGQCPGGKDCLHAQQCPAGKACAGCPAANACPLSGVSSEPPPLPKAKTSTRPK